MRDMHPTLPPDGKIEKVTDVTKAKLDALNAELYDTQFATYETTFHARSIGAKDASVSQIAFQGVYLAAAARLAAMLAVDTGMSKETFLAICGESFDVTFSNAPRFG
jgi:hypothetical protein